MPLGTRAKPVTNRAGLRQIPISSRSSWPLIDVPCTPEPTWTLKIVPASAIARASSDA